MKIKCGYAANPWNCSDDSYGIALIEVRRDAQIEAVGHRVDRASLSLFERQLRLRSASVARPVLWEPVAIEPSSPTGTGGVWRSKTPFPRLFVAEGP